MSRRRSMPVFTAVVFLLALLLPGTVLAADPVPPGGVRSSSGRVLPPAPGGFTQPSIEAQMLAEAETQTFRFDLGGRPTVALSNPATGGTTTTAGQTVLAPQSLPNGLRKEVFGFLPYWMLTDSALADLNYSLLSTIAYFSVGANKNGNLVTGSTTSPSTGWAGWTSSRMTQVIDQAHSAGVRVVLTVTMMAWDSTSAANQATLLTTPANRARLVSQIVDAVRTRAADGVNLDFEPLATSLRAPYVAFVKELKAALTDAGVGSYLTVSVMASAATWATGYDVPGLTAAGAADALFVMGYDYNWSGSSRAGGVAPIQSPYTLDVDGTMKDFLAETSGSKLIWGVPYYGRTWPTASKQLNAQTLGGGSHAYYYTGHLAQATQYGRLWDDVGQVPWYRYWDSAAGNWVEGYYDDPQSLGIKYDLINARGLAGTGMWTLLMDQGTDDLWRLLADKFVDDTAPPVGGITLLPAAVDAQEVTVSWHAIDYASGVRYYNVQYRRNGGSWHSWLSGTKASSATYAGPPGTYEFRVQAVDWKGNAQQWVTAPATPTSVSPAAFASVATSTLNIRAGAGTSYGIVTTATQGDLVYVLDGPTTANGYDWYRVQYGFTEWPAAGYPRIGWVASGTADTPYLAPAQAPSVTELDPFVTVTSVSTLFSPNGDGRRDRAQIRYSLADAADSVRLDVLDFHGVVVQSVDLGAQTAGDHWTAWNGSLSDGSPAPEGRYLLRITATSGGTTHTGPASTIDSAVRARYGSVLDRTPPEVTASDPAPGEAMVSAGSSVIVDFSEPLASTGLGSAQLLATDGSIIPTVKRLRNGGKRLILRPKDPLPADATIRVSIGNGVKDLAANPLAATSWTFATAPGSGFRPWRTLVIARGRQVAYRFGAGGAVTGLRTAWFSSTSKAKASHLGQLPNLPGRWLYVASGALSGWWVRESQTAHLKGETERESLPDNPLFVVGPGPLTGYQFDSSGSVTATRTATLGSTSAANATARAIINGRPYLAVENGIWGGYWVPESSRAYLPGLVDRVALWSQPRVDFSAGTYTGYGFGAGGKVVKVVTATLSSDSWANADAWAVINGVARYRIANGIWAGTWVPESTGITLHAG